MGEMCVHIIRMRNRTARTLVMLTTLTASMALACAGQAWAQDAAPNTAPNTAQDAVSQDAQEGDAHYHAPDVSMPGGIPLDQPATVTVMGHEVLPKKGLFEVTADLNVRGGPGTNFERVEGLKAGDRVRAVGRTEDGEWIAVSKDGITLGFVYAPILIAVVDGALSEQFFGSYMNEDIAGGVACDYRFRFERKSDVEGGHFETADYEVRFRCASESGGALFYAHMFLTEGPVDEARGMHLISLDVRSIGDGMEEFLTTSYLYHPKTGKMKFNGHTLPRFALPPKAQNYQTTSVKDALKQALEASVASWTAEAWTTLFANKE